MPRARSYSTCKLKVTTQILLITNRIVAICKQEKLRLPYLFSLDIKAKFLLNICFTLHGYFFEQTCFGPNYTGMYMDTFLCAAGNGMVS